MAMALNAKSILIFNVLGIIFAELKYRVLETLLI